MPKKLSTNPKAAEAREKKASEASRKAQEEEKRKADGKFRKGWKIEFQ